MRMWMLSPQTMCDKHLLGEHGEIHKHRHNFVKGHKISGRLSPVVQIEPKSMKSRHDMLAEEMLRRGFNHKSPYEQPDLSSYSLEERFAEVDLKISEKDLLGRCETCRKRFQPKE